MFDSSSRRAFLRGSGNTALATLAASCTGAVPVFASSDPLPHLGAEWTAARAVADAAADRMRAAYDRLQAEYGDQFPRLRIGGFHAEPSGELIAAEYVGSTEEIMTRTKRDATPERRERLLAAFQRENEAWEACRVRLGVGEAEDCEEAAWEAVYAIERRIMTEPARDFAGLRVKVAVAMAWFRPGAFDGPEIDMDIEHAYLFAVARDLDRLASQGGAP